MEQLDLLRFTVVQLSPAHITSLINRLPPSDFYVSREAALAALNTGGQFNVIHPDSGNKIDFMIARDDDWGRKQLRRRVRFELVSGLPAYAARPQDVILSKMRYNQEGGSEKHLRDIASMFKVSGDQIDRDYLKTWSAQLGVDDIWTAVQNRVGP
jgi:hypothetical protein